MNISPIILIQLPTADSTLETNIAYIQHNAPKYTVEEVGIFSFYSIKTDTISIKCSYRMDPLDRTSAFIHHNFVVEGN